MVSDRKKKTHKETPVFPLDVFNDQSGERTLYIRPLKEHLKKYSFARLPHRHDFYLVLYVESGGGTHTIDFVTYQVKPNSFYMMTPGQVHSWKLDKGTTGYVLFFTPSFYQMGQTDMKLLHFPFFHSLNHNPQIEMGKKRDPMISLLLKEMRNEYQKPHMNRHLQRSYLNIILIKLATHYKQPSAGSTLATTFKLRQLEELIDTHFKELKQPSAYADKMNLSSSYLNHLCKQSLHKTLTELISERVVLEAKRYFAYSDLTVNQVSDRLNFSNTSYFIRFFKKHTCLTPEQFKLSLNDAI